MAWLGLGCGLGWLDLGCGLGWVWLGWVGTGPPHIWYGLGCVGLGLVWFWLGWVRLGGLAAKAHTGS